MDPASLEEQTTRPMISKRHKFPINIKPFMNIEYLTATATTTTTVKQFPLRREFRGKQQHLHQLTKPIALPKHGISQRARRNHSRRRSKHKPRRTQIPTIRPADSIRNLPIHRNLDEDLGMRRADLNSNRHKHGHGRARIQVEQRSKCGASNRGSANRRSDLEG